MLPYQVGLLPDFLHVSLALAGWAATLELLALAVGVAWIGRTISARDKRRLCLVGIAIAGMACLMSLSSGTIWIYLAARTIFGLGLGLLAAATNALPAQFARPERVYAYMQVALSIVFGVTMLVVPIMIEHFGINGVFLTQMTTLLLLGPLSLALPHGRIDPDSEAELLRTPLPRGAGKALFAVTVMFIAQSTLWSFSERAGGVMGIDSTRLALVFTASAVAALAGALGATVLGERLGKVMPLVLGYGVMFFVAWAMYLSASSLMFVAGVLLLNSAQTFTLPYMQGVLAELDDSGRAPALAGAAVNFGLAAGPAIGSLMTASAKLAPLGFAGVAMFATSLVWMMLSLRQLHGTHAALQGRSAPLIGCSSPVDFS